MNAVPRFLGVLFMFLGAAWPLWGQETPPQKVPRKATDEQIQRLIEKLGESEFKAREQASRQLKDLDEALPLLRQALKGADLETSRRLQAIIVGMENRRAEQFIKQALARVNEEGLDLFIDRMVSQPDYATDARWQAGIEIVRALERRVVQLGVKTPNVLDQDFLKLPVVKNWDDRAAKPARVLINGADRRMSIVQKCLILSSDSLDSISIMRQSVLLVNGDVKSLGIVQDCIVVCNGTIKQLSQPKNCIIFCNGDIEHMSIAQDSVILVRGNLRGLGIMKNSVVEATRLENSGISENNTFLNRDAVQNVNSRNDRFETVKPSLLTLFQYFDPAKFGLTFTMVDGDARVDGIVAGKPFATAGVAKGDLLLAVNRIKFTTHKSFVTSLRRCLVAGQALLKVQRGDRVLEIAVNFGQ